MRIYRIVDDFHLVSIWRRIKRQPSELIGPVASLTLMTITLRYEIVAMHLRGTTAASMRVQACQDPSIFES